MAFQTLLVHMPFEKGAQCVLGAATALAQQHGAHLVGLHVTPMLDLPYVYDVPAVLLKQFESEQMQVTRRLHDLFDTATRSADYVADWRVLDADERSNDRLLIQQANTVDLVVVGQTVDSELRGSRQAPEGRLLAGCGRPVLLVGAEHEPTSIGERVLVAWDGQRASTRAVFAALPMLSRAKAVRLQRINTPSRDRRKAVSSIDELADTLARHGVPVEGFSADAREADIGDELLGFVSDWGADVMVAGCYEQSGLSEFLFGSTSRHLLQASPVPLLMSS